MTVAIRPTPETIRDSETRFPERDGYPKSRATEWPQITRRQAGAWTLRILGLVGLCLVYQTIEAEGLRELFSDVVGKKLSKAFPPLTGWMANYYETRKLDIANGLCFVLLIFSYASFEIVVRKVIHKTEHTIGELLILICPSVILLVFDSILFGVGVYANGSTTSPVPSILLALAYASVLVLFARWIVNIERRPS